ncbi:MAG: DUF4476 domain-containing protein [Ferruginibacter sp.]|nr:DUF4476 domain-containing protein [Ferruginibacter sp.]
MKRIQFAVFFTCLFISLNIKGQQNHFIYIQADNKQPFYVKLDKKLYSSTASGYLVVAKLKAGPYNFVIGFPKNEWPEQYIRCTVEDRDLGYLLKNFGERGWGFFNLQLLNVLMADNNEKKAEVVENVKSDAFSNMLSSVVNDPTITQNELVKEELKKTNKDELKTQPVVVSLPAQDKSLEKSKPQSLVVSLPGKDKTEQALKMSSSIISAPIQSKLAEKPKASFTNVSAPVKTEIVELPKVDPVIIRASIVKKIINKTADGMEMVYIDTADEVSDTIRIFIPADKIAGEKIQANVETVKEPKEQLKIKETSPLPVLPEEKKKDNKFIEMELPDPGKKINKVKPESAAQQAISKTAMINSDCKNFATNDDFLKLRKKMAGEENPEDMIIAAKKMFKNKCFTSEQIKNLSVLFLKDSGKYSFFDAAYPYVSDSQNYTLLEGQLTDNYYINRFKVMIRH